MSEDTLIEGIGADAPSGAHVFVAEHEFKNGLGYAISVTMAYEGTERRQTLAVLPETLDTILCLIMSLPAGLPVPGVGRVHLDKDGQFQMLSEWKEQPK